MGGIDATSSAMTTRALSTDNAPWQTHESGSWTTLGGADQVVDAIRSGRLTGASFMSHPSLSGPRALSELPGFAAYLPRAKATPTPASPPPAAEASPWSSKPQASDEHLPRYTGDDAVPGERLYSGRPGGGIVVTSRRVIFEETSVGHWERKEIPIEHVSFVAVQTLSQPLLFALAVIAMLLTSYMLASGRDGGTDQFLKWGSAAVALFFFLAYLVTRQQMIVIASSGGAIRAKASSLSRETIQYLVGRVAAAMSEQRGRA